MRIFKTKTFMRWARKEGVTDELVRKAVREIEAGLIEVDLGSCLYKKRIALRGNGKRGGARTLLAYQVGAKAFFIYGFMKNEKDNISTAELRTLKLLAANL
jgi:hypothetical protein